MFKSFIVKQKEQKARQGLPNSKKQLKRKNRLKTALHKRRIRHTIPKIHHKPLFKMR
ncbi:hypothetical protein AF61_04225 [Streptococcus uberis EF20/0145]|nr:hypothetical protein AF61_04225 [Streptococcus uberis EF20/0145]